MALFRRKSIKQEIAEDIEEAVVKSKAFRLADEIESLASSLVDAATELRKEIERGRAVEDNPGASVGVTDRGDAGT